MKERGRWKGTFWNNQNEVGSGIQMWEESKIVSDGRWVGHFEILMENILKKKFYYEFLSAFSICC